MKTVEELGAELVPLLKQWRDSKNEQIVAIEGPSGSGKTAITDYVLKTCDFVLGAPIDDFLTSAKERDQFGAGEGEEFSGDIYGRWFHLPEYRSLLSAYRKSDDQYRTKTYDRRSREWGFEKTYDLSKPILLTEGIMLFREFDPEDFDRLVFLDVPIEEAARRRYQRFSAKARTPKEKATFEAKQRKYDEAYSRYAKQHRPAGRADLVLA